MEKWTKFYLVRIEFLGFRYHGWQIQPGVKSVEGMMNKTFKFIFSHDDFKILGAGRTDARVSAEDFAFELFLKKEIDTLLLLKDLNHNLPFDIRAKSIEEINSDFNIIQHSKLKEYHYYFSYGKKSHAFNAPFMINFTEELDIELMKKAAHLFVGKHNFKRYAYKPTKHTNFEREIISSAIEPNKKFSNNFTPSKAFVFKVSSKGFLRHQVRLMVGTLIDLGRGLITFEEFKQTLTNFDGETMKHNAPSSGLTLHKVSFN